MNEGTTLGRAGIQSVLRLRRRPDRPFLRLFAWTSVLAGLALVVMAIFGIGIAAGRQYQLNQDWAQVIAEKPLSPIPLEPPPAPLLHAVNGVDFAIRVPSINYFAAVQEGVSLDILNIGPGHYPQTKWPGEQGTVGVAAHNTYWLKFADLKRGDILLLETRYGTFKYSITGTKLVSPDDRTVLVPDAPGRHLTLTTCWPLWAGALANQRLIIFSDEISASAPGGTPPKHTQAG